MLSRLRQRHAVRAAELLDACGFSALEVFGGATFEAQLRFLGEDPFDRLRALAAAAPRTPLMATLSGQMLVGHRHLPDDVVEAFIRLAAEAGIGIFRLLDPLNDVANLATAIRAAKAAGASVEGVVVCSDAGVVRPRRPGPRAGRARLRLRLPSRSPRGGRLRAGGGVGLRHDRGRGSPGDA